MRTLFQKRAGKLIGYHWFLCGTVAVLERINDVSGIRTGRAITAIKEVQARILSEFPLRKEKR